MMKYVLGGFLLFFGFCITPAIASTDSMDEGAGRQVAPDFKLRTLMQDEQSLSQVRGDKKAIIFFWATWCPYCQKEVKTLAPQLGELQQKDIKLIFVNVGEKPQKVRAFLEKNKIDVDVFLDQDSSVAEKYEIVGLPTFYYLNKSGVVKAVENQFVDDYEKVVSQE